MTNVPVKSGLIIAAIGLGLSTLFAVPCAVAAGPTNLQRLNEAQRLGLERDQRAYQETLSPLDAAQGRELQRRLQQQRAAQRRLQQEQVQRERALHHRLASEPPAAARHRLRQQLEHDRRRQERQRLQFELDRRQWSYPRR